MKKPKVFLLALLIFTLAVLGLNLAHNQVSAFELEAKSISPSEAQIVLGATIQISMFPGDSLEALGLGQRHPSLTEALAETDVEYRYELGLGTLVSCNGEILLITHDHWGSLDDLGMVQFRNAAGDPLLELGAAAFKALIRYQDGGTMILGKGRNGNPSDYLSAMVWSSQAKYSHRIHPVELELGKHVGVGDRLIVVRQGRTDSAAVELLTASVESLQERWGQTVYKLRNEDGEQIMPGDSGGGLWLDGRFVGNMWKSEYTYRWDWDAMKLHKQWSDTSYAAGLPDFGKQIPLGLEAEQIVEDVESLAGGQEF
jgi:hypothetical protein